MYFFENSQKLWVNLILLLLLLIIQKWDLTIWLVLNKLQTTSYCYFKSKVTEHILERYRSLCTIVCCCSWHLCMHICCFFYYQVVRSALMSMLHMSKHQTISQILPNNSIQNFSFNRISILQTNVLLKIVIFNY